jgi:hypothetical protein
MADRLRGDRREPGILTTRHEATQAPTGAKLISRKMPSFKIEMGVFLKINVYRLAAGGRPATHPRSAAGGRGGQATGDRAVSVAGAARVVR